MDSFVQQLEMFIDHAKKLVKIMSWHLKLDQEAEFDESIYFGVTGFCQLNLSEEEETIDKVSSLHHR